MTAEEELAELYKQEAGVDKPLYETFWPYSRVYIGVAIKPEYIDLIANLVVERIKRK